MSVSRAVSKHAFVKLNQLNKVRQNQRENTLRLPTDFLINCVTTNKVNHGPVFDCTQVNLLTFRI